MKLSQTQGQRLVAVVGAFLVVVAGVVPLDALPLDAGSLDTLRLAIQALITGIVGVFVYPEQAP